MKKEKISCLEGIRALACCGVFLSHYKGAFFPDSNVFAYIMKTPFAIFFSGNTFVRILFVLSGFVLSYKYLIEEMNNQVRQKLLMNDSIKRYFRLVFPLLVVDIIVYFLMRADLLFNVQAAEMIGTTDFLGNFNTFEESWSGCLKEGLFGNLFLGANGYVGPMWTMKYEMYGSLLCLAILALFPQKKMRYIIYCFIILFFRTYYVYFIVGMLICEVYCDHDLYINVFLKKHTVSNLILLFTVFSIIAIYSDIDLNNFRHICFSGILIIFFLSLLHAYILNPIWNCKIFKEIGQLSFAIYLLHWPIIESFSCAFYILTYSKMNYTVCMLINFSFTVVFILLAAKILNCYVIIPGVIISNEVAPILLGKNMSEENYKIR